MTQDQVLLAILGLVVVLNVVLVASIPARTRRRRRQGTPSELSPGPAPGRQATAVDDAAAAAAIEAFVDGLSAGPAGRGGPRAPSGFDDRRETVARTSPDITMVAGRATPDSADDEALPSSPAERAPSATGPAWMVDELAESATWSRTIREESARTARFGHPVTVVMAELPRLDVVGDRFGRGVADRVVSEAARLLVAEGRASDRLAWLGESQFGVVLLETTEASAGSYVDRVRTAIDEWLESTGLSIRLSLGWASPGEGGDLVAAAATATQRMHDSARPSLVLPKPRSRTERRAQGPVTDQ